MIEIPDMHTHPHNRRPAKSGGSFTLLRNGAAVTLPGLTLSAPVPGTDSPACASVGSTGGRNAAPRPSLHTRPVPHSPRQPPHRQTAWWKALAMPHAGQCCGCLRCSLHAVHRGFPPTPYLMVLLRLLSTDSEIEAVSEAPAEDLITFRRVLTQVPGYAGGDAAPTHAGIRPACP